MGVERGFVEDTISAREAAQPWPLTANISQNATSPISTFSVLFEPWPT